MPQEPAIRAEFLTKRYKSGNSELTVFESLDLCVEQGELLAVMGESGAGKSTLLHLLGGLDRPSGGRIYFGHQDLNAFSEAELADFRNRTLGFAWQSPSLLPEFTALENVIMPLLIRGARPREANALGRARLEEVGLSTREMHRPGELSGGEQQRVALARALVTNPKVLLADEPTGSLDHQTGEMILSLLKDLHRSHGLTSVFVTHNEHFAQKCDRILELKKGNLSVPALPAPWVAGYVRDATRLDGGNYV